MDLLESYADNCLKKIETVLQELVNVEMAVKIETINKIRLLLHKHSPFQDEPVDCVLWIDSDLVIANDYNPNKVAPPEMKLLECSITEDGYTQPIVTWVNNGWFEIVDGFHRHRVGKESKNINRRIQNYLPVTIIKPRSTERGNRIAATIRHNRARGKHSIGGMSDIVLELKNRNWSNARIAKKLGLDEDEILRLCQITGLADLFRDQEFSRSWDIEDSQTELFEMSEDDFEASENEKFRTVNTSDPQRIFHKYDKWECFKAGFYATKREEMTREECEEAYRDFLADISAFSAALEHIIVEWKFSCEHYLTNVSMNRIAWLGQAAMCYSTGIPSTFRGGFNLLSKEQQDEANQVALAYLNKWLKANGRDEVSLDEALSDNQMDLY